MVPSFPEQALSNWDTFELKSIHDIRAKAEVTGSAADVMKLLGLHQCFCR
jgi:hypothetical protein